MREHRAPRGSVPTQPARRENNGGTQNADSDRGQHIGGFAQPRLPDRSDPGAPTVQRPVAGRQGGPPPERDLYGGGRAGHQGGQHDGVGPGRLLPRPLDHCQIPPLPLKAPEDEPELRHGGRLAGQGQFVEPALPRAAGVAVPAGVGGAGRGHADAHPVPQCRYGARGRSRRHRCRCLGDRHRWQCPAAAAETEIMAARSGRP